MNHIGKFGKNLMLRRHDDVIRSLLCILGRKMQVENADVIKDFVSLGSELIKQLTSFDTLVFLFIGGGGA